MLSIWLMVLVCDELNPDSISIVTGIGWNGIGDLASSATDTDSDTDMSHSAHHQLRDA